MLFKLGAFTWDSGTVIGPREYMEARGFERLRRMEQGHDPLVSIGLAQHGNLALAVLVALQTDYAAWRGEQELFGTLRRGQ